MKRPNLRWSIALDCAAIGIMCKAPVPGLTKTRLGKIVGAAEAAALSAAFLQDLASTIGDIPTAISVKGYGVYSPADGESSLRKILPTNFGLVLQSDTSFGNVLHGAMLHFLSSNHDCAILVNGDSPTLPSRLLVQAISELRTPGDRMVLGPAADGGYYLIGLKFPHRRLFMDIPWGTSDVARLTIERAREISLSTILLPEWYDIDDLETLEWLRDEIAGRSQRFIGGGFAKFTRVCLAELGMAAR